MNFTESAHLTHDPLGNLLVEWCPDGAANCRMERPHRHSLILCPACNKPASLCRHRGTFDPKLVIA